MKFLPKTFKFSVQTPKTPNFVLAALFKLPIWFSNLGLCLSLLKSLCDITVTSAPVSYNQDSLTPWEIISINGLCEKFLFVEQMLKLTSEKSIVFIEKFSRVKLFDWARSLHPGAVGPIWSLNDHNKRY